MLCFAAVMLQFLRPNHLPLYFILFLHDSYVNAYADTYDTTPYNTKHYPTSLQKSIVCKLPQNCPITSR